MSVKVDLDQLADALTDFAFAYLITVGDDYRAHTVAVDAALTDGEFRVSSIGNSTRRNLTSHPDVDPRLAAARTWRLHTDRRRPRRSSPMTRWC